MIRFPCKMPTTVLAFRGAWHDPIHSMCAYSTRSSRGGGGGGGTLKVCLSGRTWGAHPSSPEEPGDYPNSPTLGEVTLFSEPGTSHAQTRAVSFLPLFWQGQTPEQSLRRLVVWSLGMVSSLLSAIASILPINPIWGYLI